MFLHGKMPRKWVFKPYLTSTYQTPLIHMSLFFLQVLRSNPFQGGGNNAILPPRALDRRLQEDWAKDARKDLRVLMSLRENFGPMG